MFLLGGGADSDILIDLIERARTILPSLPSVRYVFINTGLEMRAIKEHVKETAEKYGVEIEEIRPKVNIIQATRTCGIPLLTKAISANLETWQKKQIPLSIVDEYNDAEDKHRKYEELKERYPHSVQVIKFLCSCDTLGNPWLKGQLTPPPFFIDCLREFPPEFAISDRCCDYCKKQPSHQAQKGASMVITGERFDEGGSRSMLKIKDGETQCFTEQANGQKRLKPLFYVSDKDKAWYKETYGIRYSDAYEVYGLKRTGCCGCPISYRAVEDLKLIEPYEPNLVKAAWNVFGKSYEYRRKYNEYKAMRRNEENKEKDQVEGQTDIFDIYEKEELFGDEKTGEHPVRVED